MYQDGVLKDNSPKHKGIITTPSNNACESQVLAIVMEMSAKLTYWLVLKNGSTDLTDPLAVGSTQ